MDATSRSPGNERRYPQQLDRAIGVLGNLGITLSGVTPAASLYVIASVAYRVQGSGAVLSLVLAAVVGLGMVPCFAELGSAMPSAGGWYYVLARTLGRPIAFMKLATSVLVLPLGSCTIALGAGEYLAELFPAVPVRLTGVLIVLFATAVATLGIRLNELVTGAFLAIELLAVGVIAFLGLAHVHQPLSVLVTPQTFEAGSAGPVSLGVILAGVATGIYAYNGYDSAIVYSEETRGPRRGIARVILWAFALSVVTQLVPFAAGLLGAPSLAALAESKAPMSYLVRTLGGETLNTLVTLGLVLAIVNATIAIALLLGRLLFSTARDGLWPGPFNRWLAAIHPRWRSPWIATLAVGGINALACALLDVTTLVTFGGALLVISYGLIAVAALASRWTQPDLVRPWRMPFFPLPPLVALTGLGFVLARQRLVNVAMVGALYGAGGLYYVLYLRRRRSARWELLEPAGSDE